MHSNDFLYNTLSDLQLLLFVKNRDREAFSEIYERFWKFSFDEAFSRVKNEKLCEVIVQNVFLELWSDNELDVNDDLEVYLSESINRQLSLNFEVQKNSAKREQLITDEIIAANLAKDALKKGGRKN